MAFTPTVVHPLPSSPTAIFTGLWDNDQNSTQSSDTAAFLSGIDNRDNGACVVCGMRVVLRHCYIIPRRETSTWQLMRELHYIPNQAKSVEHESRNGILMCPTHNRAFNQLYIYIRWVSEFNQFVVVNHSRHPDFESIHGNVLHFSTETKRCPFPTAFLWHEYRVRCHNPTHDDRLVKIKGHDRGDHNSASEQNEECGQEAMLLEGEKLGL